MSLKTIDSIVGHLGADADDLLSFTCKGIPKEMLTLPGPDYIDRAFALSDRKTQVLVNLVGNAVKFTERGGVVVRVLARPTAAGEARLVVEVEDTGAGIEADQVGELFQPFAQLRGGRLFI